MLDWKEGVRLTRRRLSGVVVMGFLTGRHGKVIASLRGSRGIGGGDGYIGVSQHHKPSCAALGSSRPRFGSTARSIDFSRVYLCKKPPQQPHLKCLRLYPRANPVWLAPLFEPRSFSARCVDYGFEVSTMSKMLSHTCLPGQSSRPSDWQDHPCRR